VTHLRLLSKKRRDRVVRRHEKTWGASKENETRRSSRRPSPWSTRKESLWVSEFFGIQRLEKERRNNDKRNSKLFFIRAGLSNVRCIPRRKGTTSSEEKEGRRREERGSKSLSQLLLWHSLRVTRLDLPSSRGEGFQSLFSLNSPKGTRRTRTRRKVGRMRTGSRYLKERPPAKGGHPGS